MDGENNHLTSHMRQIWSNKRLFDSGVTVCGTFGGMICGLGVQSFKFSVHVLSWALPMRRMRGCFAFFEL
jgi:3-dehydroquinate dehydratase